MNKTAPFSMRMPPPLKDAMQKLADADKRSLTNYVEKLIAEHVAAKAKTGRKQ